MGIVIENNPAVDNNGATSTGTLTIAGVVVGSILNSILVLCAGNERAATTISGVTYGGVALTLRRATHPTTWSNAEIWYLLAPAAGTADVVITYSNATNQRKAGGVYVCSGVNQSTPWRSSQIDQGDSAAVASVTVPSVAADDLLIDALCIDGTGHNPVLGADQTQGFLRDPGTGENETVSGWQLGSAGGVMSWTWTTAAPFSYVSDALIADAGSRALALMDTTQFPKAKLAG